MQLDRALNNKLSEDGMSKKVMLVDGNSIVNRAFYALPLLTDKQGRYTNAVYGFLNIVLKLMDEEKPEYMAVAFDMHAPTFRHKSYEGYKGTRKKMPEELKEQMPLLKETLGAMKVKMFGLEGYEADDILGTLVKKSLEAGIDPVVVSGDRDLLQLAGDNVKIRIPKTKMNRTEVEDYYAEDVKQKYGVTPAEFIEMKALMGDASDNIPGVPGIGEKTAMKIISEFGTVENALENWEKVKPAKASKNLHEFVEQARLSRFLVEIECGVPMEINFEEMGCEGIFNSDSFEMFRSLGFKKLLERFEIEGVEPSRQEENEEELIFIETAGGLQEYFARAKGAEEFAYTMFSDEKEIRAVGLYCREAGGACAIISDEELPVSSFKEFFENSKYKKLGSDIKSDIRLLDSRGIECSGMVFDAAIAAYLIEPTDTSYSYSRLAYTFLDKTYPSPEEILGRGKSTLKFFQLDEESKLNLTARTAEVIYKAKPELEKKLAEYEQTELYYDVELPLVFVLRDMEKCGMKVNKDALIEYGDMLQKDIDKVTQEIYILTGEQFNINSPKQLGEILFEKLGLPGGKKTQRGYSTAAETLDRLRADYPVVDKVLFYRQLTKLKSTYVDGLLADMDGDCKIHSTFNQTVTATGRISSTEPNLQNIPIRLALGRELRKVFVPGSDDFVFLDADYSQIELRVLAHIAGDETLIDAFKNGQDIHRLTASQVFGVSFDEVTDGQRSDAKAVNFGIVYGISSFSLSQDLGITRKEAETYMNSYFAKYPKIKTYLDETIASAARDGYVKTMCNRRRSMPELKSANFNVRSFGERVAMNMPIQGSAADIIKIAMIRVHNALKNGRFKSRLVLQVHDELLIEAHRSEIDEVSKILKEEMENAYVLAAPLTVDVHTGGSWFEAK